MACTSSCRSQDHSTWGECVRAKNLRTNAMEPELVGQQRKADKALDNYAKARSFGIQPKSTRAGDVERAIRTSEATGSAFKG